VSGKGLIPAVSKGGNEENDKKKTNKNRSGSFWKIYLIEADLEFFLAYRVRKNNSTYYPKIATKNLKY